MAAEIAGRLVRWERAHGPDRHLDSLVVSTFPDQMQEKSLLRARKHALIVGARECGGKNNRQCFFQAGQALSLSE
jgi:hypothetical protein